MLFTRYNREYCGSSRCGSTLNLRVGGSIPGLGTFYTVSMAPNVGSSRLYSAPACYSRCDTNMVAVKLCGMQEKWKM